MQPAVNPPAAPSAANPTAESLAVHMHLVHKVVAHFVRRLPSSVQREDLVAAGTLGLFFALRSSTHTCDEMFASYARIRIRGAIVDELRRHDWSPRRRRTPAPTTPANDTTPPEPPAAIALPSNVRVLPTAKARAAHELPASQVETPVRVAVVGFDDLPPHQMQLALGDTGDGSGLTASPELEVEEKRTCEELRAAVAALPPRERAIIRMRYFEALPSKAIASALGLSEARISQLHARATARLREILDGRADGGVGMAA